VIVGDNLVVYYGDKQATTYDAKVSYSNTLKYIFCFINMVWIYLVTIILCHTQNYNQFKVMNYWLYFVIIQYINL